MLTEQQRESFEQQEYARLRGVFSVDEAAAMEDCLWNVLHRKHGVERDDPNTWHVPLGLGLQSLRTNAVFAPIGAPSLLAALDDLIGPGRWVHPEHWGQFLVSFPTPTGAIRSRPNWHTDFPYSLTPDRTQGTLVLSYIADVPVGAGGTHAIAGSHKLVARFLGDRPGLRKVKMKVTRQAILHSDPWLRSLCSDWTEEDWVERLPTTPHVISELPVRVIELDGAAGDVVLAHPWLLHSSAPNRGDQPRMMRVQRIRVSKAS